MKKLLKIVFILLLILIVIVGAGVFLFLKHFDINKYKPMILAEAKKELDRDINFSSANFKVSLSQGLALKLNDLQIDDSPAYQTDKLLQIGELSLGIDFISYILQKKIYISNIHLKSAQLTIIKNQDGLMNIEELAKPHAKQDSSSESIEQPASPSKKPDKEKISLPQILINSFIFKDCAVKYIDKSTVPVTKLEISKINFKALAFSPSHPSSFEIGAAVFSETQNLNCAGTLKLDLNSQKVTLQPLEINLDLSKLSFDKIKSAIPSLKNKPLPSDLKGKFHANIKKTAFTPSGLLDFNADLNYSNGKIAIESLNMDKINFNISNFSLSGESSYSFDMAFLNDSPNISSSGFIKPNLISNEIYLRNIKISTDLESFSMDQLKKSFPELKDKPLPSELKGQLYTNIKKISLTPDGLNDLIADLNFSNGKIIIKNPSKNTYIDINKINFNILNFSLNDECSYSLGMAFLNDSPNISSTGFLKTNLENNELNFRDIKFSTDLSSFSIDELKKSFPDLPDSDLPDELSGNIQAVISRLYLSKDGLYSLQAEGGLSKGKIVMSEKLKSPVENIDATWVMNENTFNLNKLYMKIGQGEITGSAQVENYLTQKKFNMLLNLVSLDFSELINQTKQSIKLEGKLDGSLNIWGQGLEKEEIINSLSGMGDLSISDGKLKDINILKIVLDKLTMFPNLSKILEAGLPEKYKEKLTQKDTILTKANMKTSFANRKIILTPLTVYADNFTFQGKGDASFDKNFVLKGAFYVPQNLSLRMVKRVNELEYILDEQNRLFIPLQVHGTGTDLKFIVDLKYLSKKVIKTQGREELKKIIYKSLKKDTEQEQQNTTSQPQTSQDNQQYPSDNQPNNEQNSPEKETKSIEEVILDNVLDRLFKMDEY